MALLFSIVAFYTTVWWLCSPISY